MPEVKGKHYPYTPAGRAAAKRAAKKTGTKIKNAKKKTKKGRR